MKKIEKIYIIGLIILSVTMVVSCKPTPEQLAKPLAETMAAIPTQTAYPTYTPENTQTPYPTYTVIPTYTPWIKIVTPTFTSTPKYTPTLTNTPTITSTPTNTPNPLTKDKKNGFYLVGIDIAPGLWRSTGNSDGCYWALTSKTGDIIDNHFGMSGGTMFIVAFAFQVELEDCGTWVYLGQ